MIWRLMMRLALEAGWDIHVDGSTTRFVWRRS